MDYVYAVGLLVGGALEMLCRYSYSYSNNKIYIAPYGRNIVRFVETVWHAYTQKETQMHVCQVAVRIADNIASWDCVVLARRISVRQFSRLASPQTILEYTNCYPSSHFGRNSVQVNRNCRAQAGCRLWHDISSKRLTKDNTVVWNRLN